MLYFRSSLNYIQERGRKMGNDLKGKGFLGNELYKGKYGNEIATAFGGRFYEGFTTLRFSDLHEGVEGKDLLYDVMLKELVNHKQALLDGKQVNIHLEWELTQDRMDYASAKFIKTEIVESVL